MEELDFLKDLKNCELCEHRCGVNRLEGEMGVCRMTMPVVASATLHPAPPESYTVFMAGCNYRCLNCQNWTISQYPDNGIRQRGYEDPKDLAKECVHQLESWPAKIMAADRIFFSGGEATIHLPYIEKVVEEARKIKPDIKVNFDTNGYLTEKSLNRVLDFTNSITYDLKAYHDEVHRALTGTSSDPVLRNAEYIGRYAKEKLWEYRILVIPRMNEDEIKPLSEFIADIDTELPVCFLAFRPNFILEHHCGAGRIFMDKCVAIAKDSGLESVSWSGYTDIPGCSIDAVRELKANYQKEGACLAGSYAFYGGCHTHPRNCAECSSSQNCEIKRYIPRIST
jgi:pyruvate formate lyase activating enzyme